MTPEKRVENAILTYLKYKRIFCWKNQSVGIYDAKKNLFRKSRNQHAINGVSDILGILPNGKFLAIEVKTDNTRFSKKSYATDSQKVFIENIKANGGLAFVARSIDDVEKELTAYFANLKMSDSVSTEAKLALA